MSWKKHFKDVNIKNQATSSVSSIGKRAGPARTNYSSFLPDVYAGSPNRIDRYIQYDTMDMDSEVNAALDILAEFCTQKDKENGTPFTPVYRSQPTRTEVKLIKESLQAWCKAQQFNTRIFKIFRNALKYGDQVFVRDPQTRKLLHVDMSKVVKIIANESRGKVPEQYVLKDINFNFREMIATTPHMTTNTSPSGVSSYVSGGSFGRGMVGAVANTPGTRFQNEVNEVTVDSDHVIHLSLSDGLDPNYPFGNSILESVFKVYKQKELLEDAIIIYRIQRAPERRIFYIDVGSMPAHMAMSFVERVKNEIQQRRIPSVTGGGQSTVDASYNPLSTNEDFFFPQSSEGRGSKVETLPGGCFAMDTEVVLLDGRVATIAELAKEYQEGRVNWTYSADPETGQIVPGPISWAGVTQASARVIKLTLSNGKTITCTPEHKYPILGRGLVQAQDLAIGEVFIDLNTQQVDKELYVYNSVTNQWLCAKDLANNYLFEDTDIRVLDANSVPSKVTLVKVEELDTPIEVGTLTIDKDEFYHSYHNFALAVGVFAQNSNLGEITDLRYFTNKLFRALRIPSSYLPTAIEESPNAQSDGKVGIAYIQELRFNEYCKRLQSMLIGPIDTEFKVWLHANGINIDPSIFELQFNPPQNFAAYRQSELDNTRINVFTSVQEIPYLSKRFAMKRFLGLTEEEIRENEMLWFEENPDSIKGNVEPVHSSGSPAGALRGIGVTPGAIADDMSSQTQEAPMDMEGPSPDLGGEAPMQGPEAASPAATPRGK